MEEYKSVIMIVPYVGTVTNGNTLLQPLGKEEVEKRLGNKIIT